MHNRAIMKTIYLRGTPKFVMKILTQIAMRTLSPLKYLTIDLTLTSETDHQDIH